MQGGGNSQVRQLNEGLEQGLLSDGGGDGTEEVSADGKEVAPKSSSCAVFGSTLAAASAAISEAYFFGLSNRSGLQALGIYQGAGHVGFDPCTDLPKNPINFTVAGGAGWFIGTANIADAANSVFAMGAHFAGEPPVHIPDIASSFVMKYQALKSVPEAAETDRLVPAEAAVESPAAVDDAPAPCCDTLAAFGAYNRIIGSAGVVLASTSSLTGAAALSEGASDGWWIGNLVAGGGIGTVGQVGMYALSTDWEEPVKLAGQARQVYQGISRQPWHIQASFYGRSVANILFRGLSFGYAGQALPGAINAFTKRFSGHDAISGSWLAGVEASAAAIAGWGGAHMGFLGSLREAKGLATQKPRAVDGSILGITATALDFYIGPGWRPRGRPTPGRAAAYALFLLTTAARMIDMNGQVYSLLSAGAHVDPGACGTGVKVAIDGGAALASTVIATLLVGAAAQRQAYYMPAVALALETGFGTCAYPSAAGLDKPGAEAVVDLTDAGMEHRLDDAQVRVLFSEEELEPTSCTSALQWFGNACCGGWRASGERLDTARSAIAAAKARLAESGAGAAAISVPGEPVAGAPAGNGSANWSGAGLA